MKLIVVTLNLFLGLEPLNLRSFAPMRVIASPTKQRDALCSINGILIKRTFLLFVVNVARSSPNEWLS